ncbi:MAG: hypothetical protein IT160_02055 [Bryobacterales bacterium]|nr:hypothetical protein [Bryobacterales bacterium]
MNFLRHLTLLAASIGLAPAAAPPGFPPVYTGDLAVATDHPRLVFRNHAARGFGRTIEYVRSLDRNDPTFHAIFARALDQQPTRYQHPALFAACWVVTGKDEYAQTAIEWLLNGKITRSGSGSYSDVWSYALAYDWLFNHPAMTPDRRNQIEQRIIERLESELAQLEETYMAMWHGRNQAANGAMVAALAVAGLPGQKANLRRAAAHYGEALRALQLTEGWPEGASYWIYNRAGPYALAADCVITALGRDHFEGISIREVMRKVGLWSVYQLTPAGFFEPYGDSQGSLVPGETGWWEITADYFARISGDPAVMAGADYIRNRAATPYGRRPYQWWAAISYDPAPRPSAGYDAARPELWMRAHMPQSMLFGRASLGITFLRGAWGDPDELYATFKAGDMLAHHDHYDTGAFAIQYGGLLAPRTGLYGPGGYDGTYRLGYTIQTVSSNSLLVFAPGETSAALRAVKGAHWDALSGGQRVIRPTGFDCVGLAHYRSLLESGPHLKRATMLAYDSVPEHFDYLAADITAAYNSTHWAEPGSAAKVSLVTRQFLYLRPERAFVIYDRVETTKPEYTTAFLLHSLAKPEGGQEQLVAGSSPEDGILLTSARRFTTGQERGVLTHVVLLPSQSRAVKIGGPNFNNYVEEDGDEADGFNGVNLPAPGTDRVRNGAQAGLWRIQIEPSSRTATVRFLNVLLPRLKTAQDALLPVELLKSTTGAHAARIGTTVVVFAHDNVELSQAKVEIPVPASIILAGAKPLATYRLGSRKVQADREGVAAAQVPAGSLSITLVR